jgi:hypothetical protein
MTTTERIAAIAQQLSAEDQQQVLDYMSKLLSAQAAPAPNPAPNGSDSTGSSIWAGLAQIGKAAEGIPTDLPEDLAANHDYYLHGLPKRR